MRIELRRNVRIESNRKVPQTNRLSFGVLDMDEVLCCKLDHELSRSVKGSCIFKMIMMMEKL